MVYLLSDILKVFPPKMTFEEPSLQLGRILLSKIFIINNYHKVKYKILKAYFLYFQKSFYQGSNL